MAASASRSAPFIRRPEQGKTRPDRALLLHPGHPLMLAMTDLLLRNTNLLREGAVLIDPRSPDEAPDATTEPWLLVLLTHEVKSGDGLVLSKRLQFVRVSADGTSTFAGWAPHLDLDPLLPEDRPTSRQRSRPIGSSSTWSAAPSRWRRRR